MAETKPRQTSREDLEASMRKDVMGMGRITGRLEAFNESSVLVTEHSADIMALVSNPTESLKVHNALINLAIELLSKH